MARFFYSQEHIDFICSINHLKRTDIARMMNEKFGTNIGKSAVCKILLRNGYKSSSNGQFKKGHKAWNKGLEGVMNPSNLKPMFSERIDKRGYALIKTKDGFVPKGRYVYEQYHGVKVEKNQIVIFIDGNNQNFDIENLRVISCQEWGLMSGYRYHNLPAELKRMAVNIVKIESKILERGEL